MNLRNAELHSLLASEKACQRLISEEWNKKISIYADMLFSMNPSDFIDFMTGGMAYALGFFSFMTVATPSDAFGNVCIDPEIIAANAAGSAGLAIFFGALHMLYRYSDDNKYRLDGANRSIESYTAMKLKAANRRYTLFPESNKSCISSAVESARKYLGI